MTKSMPLSDGQMDHFQAAFERIQSPSIFSSWFAGVGLVRDADASKVTVIAPSRFVRDYLENNHETDIEKCLVEVFSAPQRVFYRIGKAQKVLREKPKQDEQLDFFVPQLSETAIRDEIHLMEVAPFTLSKRESRTKLVYTNLNGMNLTITCNPDYGMMTAHDYDFVLMMMSHLNAKANEWRPAFSRWKKGGQLGDAPKKPSRVFRPHTNDIIKFMRRSKGGRNYAEVEAMLDRLKNCAGKIERTGRRKRRAGSFSFIDQYSVISRADTGNILQVEITVPDWIYEGIVREEAPTLLTCDPDYMLVQKPLGKFLYRTARLKAQKEDDTMALNELHARSGSRAPLKEFNKELTTYLRDLEDLEGTENAFPEYQFVITGKPRQRMLYMKFREYIPTAKSFAQT